MPTVAELGRLLGRQSLVKEASTALVRRIAQGLLSPKSIQRAAQAMPEGSFRFVKNLGRGQFSLADKVVGNMGGHAGEMVRKVATHADLAPNQEYGPLKKLIDGYNATYGKQSGGNPIAPYVAVNPRGAFQQLATETVTPPRELTNKLSDLHSANIGPGGQIFDFGTTGSALSQQGANSMNYFRPRIDPATQIHSGRYYGRDMLGNLSEQSPKVQAAAKPASNQVDNNIRRFWALPTLAARNAHLGQVAQTADARGQQLLKALPDGKIPFGSGTQAHSGALNSTVSPGPTRQPGWWDRLKLDFQLNKPTYIGVPLTGAAAGAAGYGAYRALQPGAANPVAGTKPLALPK